MGNDAARTSPDCIPEEPAPPMASNRAICFWKFYRDNGFGGQYQASLILTSR
ncbi:MAG: hypothetical protein CM15mP46_6680 [Alphaproteobacteria bacterium]|nr:MAG: hypothetical protein CM15mP46_6680 [Alphaproteobacteria bacterium]